MRFSAEKPKKHAFAESRWEILQHSSDPLARFRGLLLREREEEPTSKRWRGEGRNDGKIITLSHQWKSTEIMLYWFLPRQLKTIDLFLCIVISVSPLTTSLSLWLYTVSQKRNTTSVATTLSNLFCITAAMARSQADMEPGRISSKGPYQHQISKWHLDPWSFHWSEVNIGFRARSVVLCSDRCYNSHCTL